MKRVEFLKYLGPETASLAISGCGTTPHTSKEEPKEKPAAEDFHRASLEKRLIIPLKILS
jgi:hypothetical protein